MCKTICKIPESSPDALTNGRLSNYLVCTSHSQLKFSNPPVPQGDFVLQAMNIYEVGSFFNMASDYHALLCTRISTVLHTFRSQLDSYTCFKYKITMKDRLNRLSVKIVVSSLRTGTRNPLFASVLFVDCEENFRFFLRLSSPTEIFHGRKRR